MAEVEAVNQDRTFDVRYKEDGIREAGLPISRIKMKGDPLDYQPLLSLLDEVKQKLTSLTPNRPDIKSQV